MKRVFWCKEHFTFKEEVEEPSRFIQFNVMLFKVFAQKNLNIICVSRNPTLCVCVCVCVCVRVRVCVSYTSDNSQLPCHCHGSMPGKTAVELGPLW